jgi:hypothetical protein
MIKCKPGKKKRLYQQAALTTGMVRVLNQTLSGIAQEDRCKQS